MVVRCWEGHRNFLVSKACMDNCQLLSVLTMHHPGMNQIVVVPYLLKSLRSSGTPASQANISCCVECKRKFKRCRVSGATHSGNFWGRVFIYSTWNPSLWFLCSSCDTKCWWCEKWRKEDILLVRVTLLSTSLCLLQPIAVQILWLCHLYTLKAWLADDPHDCIP